MDYRQALTVLKKNNLPSVLLLHGEERYLVDDLVTKILHYYVEEGMEEMDVSRFDAQGLKEIHLLTALQSVALFSKKRVVLLSDAQKLELTDGLKEKLKKGIPQSVLVFLPGGKDGCFRQLKGLSEEIECKKISQREMELWIQKELSLVHKTMEKEAVTLFVGQSRYFEYGSSLDLYYLKSELDKLSSTPDPIISASRVKELMQVPLEENVFLLLEQLTKQNKKQVFRLYRDFVSGGNSLYSLVPMMVKNYYQLLIVKVLQESGIPMQSWNLPLGINSSFIQRKLSTSATTLERSTILGALSLCLETEALYKSQSVDMESIVQNLLLELLSSSWAK